MSDSPHGAVSHADCDAAPAGPPAGAPPVRTPTAAAPATPPGLAARAPALPLTPLSPATSPVHMDAVSLEASPSVSVPRPLSPSPVGASSAWRRPPLPLPRSRPRLMCPCTSCRPPEPPGSAFPTGRIYSMHSWRQHIKAHFSEERDFVLLTSADVDDIIFIAHGHGLGVCLVCRRLGSRDCSHAAVCRRTDAPPVAALATARTWRNGQAVGRDVSAYHMDRSLRPGAPPARQSSRDTVPPTEAPVVLGTVYNVSEPPAAAAGTSAPAGAHWQNASGIARNARLVGDGAMGTGRMDDVYVPLAPTTPGPRLGSRPSRAPLAVARRPGSPRPPSGRASKRARLDTAGGSQGGGRSLPYGHGPRASQIAGPVSAPPAAPPSAPLPAPVVSVVPQDVPAPGLVLSPASSPGPRAEPSGPQSAAPFARTPLSALPTDEGIFTCPLRASDVYDVIPSECLPTYEMLLIKILWQIASAPRDSPAKERAWRIFFITPMVVARRTLRGEKGFRSIKHQTQALRRRILRATNDNAWAELWQEMLDAEAHQARKRDARVASRQRRELPTSGPGARAVANATRLAKAAAYGRATKALAQAPSLSHDDPAILERLQSLHPAPPSPIVGLPETALPLRVVLDPAKVSRAVRQMDATSSAGVDHMPVRLLHLVAQAENTPREGQSGLELLTEVCTEVINADVPVSIVPLLSAARLVPIDKGDQKIRPVAIGGVLRRLVTKIAIADDIPRNVPYLLPEQVCSGVRAGGEAMFHSVRELMDARGNDSNLVLVSIDASNAFNRFSRQKMLDLIVERCPALARFVNMIYGGEPPALMYGSHHLDSREGAQQGDPAAMLLFSLVIQPILKRLSAECPDLLLTLFYADDGTLIGTPEAIARALALIEREGPSVGYFIKPEKSKVYWPTMSMERLAPLLAAYPSLLVQGSPTGVTRSCGEDDGITIFGAPLGSDAYVAKFLRERLDGVREVLGNISELPDPRLAFQLQRTTASVCRFTHLARLLPTPVMSHIAAEFDALQRSSLTGMSGVCLTPGATAQLTLPARLGGLGLTSLRLIAPLAHASSLLDTASLRARWRSTAMLSTSEHSLIAAVDPLITSIRPTLAPIPDLPIVDAAAVAAHPEHNQRLLTGAMFQRRADQLWREGEWRGYVARRRAAPADLLALRARHNALTCPASTAFLSASYHDTGFISPPVWGIILRRFLGLHVYDGPSEDLWCPACAVASNPLRVPLDRNGYHSLACLNGYGAVARHNAVARRLVRYGLRPAGMSCRREVPFLVPQASRNIRPADIYVEHPTPATGAPPPQPHALDVTVVSPHPPASGDVAMLTKAARTVGGRASHAYSRKISDFIDKVQPAKLHELPFTFHPMAFDTYGTPAAETSLYLRDVAKAIARRSGAPIHLCTRRIYQQTSFAVWATVAQSVLIRDPARLRAAGYAGGV